MHIELIDLLRCPVVHEETWLVAALHEMDGRHVIEAKLGCPVCGAAFFVRGGVALFSDDPPVPGEASDQTKDDAIRIAAFLGLTTPGKTVLLTGELAAAAAMAAELAEGRAVSMNAPAASAAARSDRVGEIRADRSRVPLASSSLDGIGLDVMHTTPEMISEASRILRPGGRLLAAASAVLPGEFRDLARDDHHVVAEFVGELITLRH